MIVRRAGKTAWRAVNFLWVHTAPDYLNTHQTADLLRRPFNKGRESRRHLSYVTTSPGTINNPIYVRNIQWLVNSSWANQLSPSFSRASLICFYLSPPPLFFPHLLVQCTFIPSWGSHCAQMLFVIICLHTQTTQTTQGWGSNRFDLCPKILKKRASPHTIRRALFVEDKINMGISFRKYSILQFWAQWLICRVLPSNVLNLDIWLVKACNCG